MKLKLWWSGGQSSSHGASSIFHSYDSRMAFLEFRQIFTQNNSFYPTKIKSPPPPSAVARSAMVRSAVIGDGESPLMANSVRVAAAQMTSINDLAANFSTCSRLVKMMANSVLFVISLMFVYAKGSSFSWGETALFPKSFSFVGAKDGDSIKVAQSLDGPIMQGYCDLARDSKIWLSLGGFQEKGPDDAHLCNTHVLVDDDGNIRSSYRKIHL